MERRARRRSHPLLTALRARGSIAVEGAPLSYLLVEVRGGRLMITGRTPLKDDGSHYTHTGDAYRYVLEGGEAEKLLGALCRDFGSRPERSIVREFEFSRPRRPLYEYLDDLHLKYEYHIVKGEAIK